MPTKARSSSARRQQRQDKARGNSCQRGYGWKWRKYSEAYRQSNPLCVQCKAEGHIRLAEHVDHIQAVSGPDDPGFWDADNHAGLCAHHHSLKTVREDGGFGL